MNTIRTGALAAAIAILAPRGAAAVQNTMDGAQVYARTCGRCHNPRSPLERADRDWTVIVSHMRVRGNLTGAESRAVREFLQAMNARPQPATEPAAGPGMETPVPAGISGAVDNAMADRGRELVARFSCAACHRIGDQTAGTLGPDLNTVLKRRTPEYVLQKLATPTFDNANSMMPQAGLTADQRRAVLEYLRTVQR